MDGPLPMARSQGKWKTCQGAALPMSNQRKNRIVNEEWKEIFKNGDPWCQDGMVAGNSMERWDVIAG